MWGAVGVARRHLSFVSAPVSSGDAFFTCRRRSVGGNRHNSLEEVGSTSSFSVEATGIALSSSERVRPPVSRGSLLPEAFQDHYRRRGTDMNGLAKAVVAQLRRGNTLPSSPVLFAHLLFSVFRHSCDQDGLHGAGETHPSMVDPTRIAKAVRTALIQQKSITDGSSSRDVGDEGCPFYTYKEEFAACFFKMILEQCNPSHQEEYMRWLLTDSVGDDDVSAHLVQRMTAWLYHRQRDHGGDGKAWEAVVTALLQGATPAHTADVVLGMMVMETPCIPGRLKYRWADGVNPSLARLCLHRIASVVRERRNRDAFLSDAELSSLFQCALCRHPEGLGFATHAKGEELGYLSISILKAAPCAMLCDVFEYLEKRRMVTESCRGRFLANCGMRFSHSIKMTVQANPREKEVILRAFSALCRTTPDGIQRVEEGLVHGCAALNAFGMAQQVRQLYWRFPTLRETAHSVYAAVQMRDVKGSISAVAALRASQPKGWITIPPLLWETLAAVCRLTGECGSPEDVPELYSALVSMGNAGMLTSQLIEHIIAGLCDRIVAVERYFGRDVSHIRPNELIGHVIPMARAVLSFTGDDMNADTVFALLETAVTMDHAAVPLTSALVWAMKHTRSLSVQDLFRLGGKGTNSLPFIQFYVLCYARDQGRRDTLEHLATVWQTDSDPIWNRVEHLQCAYKLWECLGCGRLNSDRYNYCACSNMRNCLIQCVGCGYAQDERLTHCRCCGSAMGHENRAGVVLRKSWKCDSCQASNPARQMLKCFRCAKPRGPVFVSLRPKRSTSSCQCHPPKPSDPYSDRVGFCRDCGTMREKHSKATASVWRCAGCHQFRSSLERTCPTCPQVECLVAAHSHAVTEPRACQTCGVAVANPFHSHCAACGGEVGAAQRTAKASARKDAVLKFVTSTNDDVDDSDTTTQPNYAFCFYCGIACRISSDTSDNLQSQPCPTCHTELSTPLQLQPRHCAHCGNDVDATWAGAVCHYCASYLPPMNASQWPTVISAATAAALVLIYSAENVGVLAHQDLDAKEGGDGPTWQRLCDVLLALRQHGMCTGDSIANDHADSLRATQVIITALTGVMTAVLPYLELEPLARRAAALLQQLLQRNGVTTTYVDERRCSECLGTHPVSLCPQLEDSIHWACGVCGVENTNPGLGRYICVNCLSLRDVVEALLPSQCWRCTKCRLHNLDFEHYCVRCGHVRPVGLKREDWAADDTSLMLPENTRVEGLTPFYPSKCSSCGHAYLEFECPLCHPSEQDDSNQHMPSETCTTFDTTLTLSAPDPPPYPWSKEGPSRTHRNPTPIPQSVPCHE